MLGWPRYPPVVFLVLGQIGEPDAVIRWQNVDLAGDRLDNLVVPQKPSGKARSRERLPGSIENDEVADFRKRHEADHRLNIARVPCSPINGSLRADWPGLPCN